MKDNSFVDTNILVYCYTNDEPKKREKALTVCNNMDTFISTQVLTELSNTLKKKFKLDWKSIELVISEINSGFHIFVNKPGTIEKACQIANKYNYSFYDSLIIAAALACNCSSLYSEDLQHGQIIENSLTIVNPFK
ncbi:PIN domain-containing protein [Draconibacterium sp.]|jgi:predicted nucleic acid-binding protein